ncbi:MAG TPA: DUF4386 domain-containing protein [Candidatus Limnocylindria bacterium]|nr:DUF4386 domain-containing protein [Candidatus Limnocylindria bacterium]
MTVELATAVLLIALPVAFNLAFLDLARAFDYPAILREPADTVLRRFEAGGTGLVLRWYAFFTTALLMLPLVALVGVVLGARPALTATSIVVGASAALVQVLGLARWPFVVPELARRYVAADGPDAKSTRNAVAIVFETLHRLLGVAIGEHLGYLLTGVWTLLIGASIVSTSVVPIWLGIAGLPIGAALIVGALEFVGPNEPRGWAFAETLVPIAYISWSIWLVAIGVAIAL